MQASGARALKALTSRIHSNPLPLSKKESHQLLNLLSQSFDRHLDRYHPVHDVEEPTLPPVSKSTASESRLPGKPTSTQASPSRLSHAAQILDVLNHPLMARKPERPKNPPVLPNRSKLTSCPSIPLRKLEEKFANATVTELDIFACLKAICGPITRKISTSQRMEIRAINASRKIDAWLKPGAVNPIHGLYYNRGVRQLWTKLLVIEGRQDALKAAIASGTQKLAKAKMLARYIASEMDHGEGPESAIREVLALGSADHISHTISVVIMPRIPSLAKKLPIDLYDQVAQFVKTEFRPFDIALMSLFHPTRANSGPAFKFITALTPEEIEADRQSTSQSQLIVSMCLKLAHRLLDEGRLDDTQRVLRFMQEHYPEQLAERPSVEKDGRHRTTKKSEKRPVSQDDERKYLEALDSLLAT